jgi:transketolase C-terminal domain/subunit
MGMAEQLLMGAAGGLAKEGFMPFVTTYTVLLWKYQQLRPYSVLIGVAAKILSFKIIDLKIKFYTIKRL